MQVLPNPDTTFGSSGINPGGWEDRGTLWFSEVNASTSQKVQSYCKDIAGCGDKDYRSVSGAVTLNYLDGCVPTINGVLSMKGLFFNNASGDNILEMGSIILGSPAGQPGGGELLAAAAVACPVTPPIVTP